jgi:hypothetical protein
MEKNSKNDLIQALRAGAQGTARSKAARLREIIDEVEAAKESGLGHKQIVAILESRGLSFTLGSFEITLHRIQKNRGKTGKAKESKDELEGEYPEAETAVAVPAAPVAPAAATGNRRPQIFKPATGMLSELKPSEPDGLVDLKQQ